MTHEPGAESSACFAGPHFPWSLRVSLGGVHDEAEIRGHRRTYIGSMPGKIIQLMRKAKTSNPLFLLDEVDKMGSDFRGDPSSALLEVLNSEQDRTFNDHYLEVDYDLSSVMFITTANTLNIPPPLMDRMEIIRIAGYTEDEKVEIARKHLIPNVTTKHRLDAKEWAIDDEALLTIIRRYTREAGVSSLERELSTLICKAVKELILSEKKSVKARTAADDGRHRADLGGQPPGAVLAHHAAPRPVEGERAGPDHHDRIRGASGSTHPVQRSQRQALLSELWPLRRNQAGQYPLHVRTGRRLDGTWVTANCFHPGLVATGFNRNNGLLMDLGMTIISRCRKARRTARRPLCGSQLRRMLAM